MTKNELDAWRNRSITVKVFDLCETRDQLRDDVKELQRLTERKGGVLLRLLPANNP